MNHVTLDGVMQGPGRAEEDTRGGFRHGGWGHRTQPDDALQNAMSERMTAGGGLSGWLFGRRTYEDLLGYWNGQPDSPFGPMLNDTPKYVVSSTLADPLPWPNSTLLRGEVADAVIALKAKTDGVLGIMGSGELIGADGSRLGRRVPVDVPPVRAGGREAVVPGQARRVAGTDPEREHVDRRGDRGVRASQGLSLTAATTSKGSQG
jgi:dihydrofolate reductase